MEPGKEKAELGNPEHGTWETTENGNFTEAWKRALALPGSGFQVPPLLSPFRVPGSAVAVAVPGSAVFGLRGGAENTGKAGRRFL
jgi:hypothetical protein